MPNIIGFVNAAFQVYYVLLIVRIILSWVPVNPSSDLAQSALRFVYDITEPYLALFRRLLPTFGLGGGGIDFSPIIAIIVLGLIQRAAITILSSLLFL
ncbi:MAG: YggT family protein [Terriglobia bacterium]